MKGFAMYKMLIATVLSLLVLTPALAAQDPNRIVTAVDEVGKTFNCHAKAGEPSWTYRTTNKTVFRAAKKRVRLSYVWNKGSFSELKVGDIVTVQYHLSGNDRIAERVAIYPNH
jgi:hypothetical protein